MNRMIKEDRKGLTANTLKLLAIVTMLIDHTAVALVWPMVTKQDNVYVLYRIMRYIGRIAFPVYCFFIVEGLIHTRSAKKYLGRLLLFAVISELPFDYALLGGVTMEYQNVFFTLALGLLCIWGFQKIETYQYTEKFQKFYRKYVCKAENEISQNVVKSIMKLLLLFITYQAAEMFHTDYGGFGVVIIVVLYIFRNNRKKQCIAGAIGFCWEITAPLAFWMIYFYNGEKGKSVNKYLFYTFYPAHLLLLAIIGNVFGV